MTDTTGPEGFGKEGQGFRSQEAKEKCMKETEYCDVFSWDFGGLGAA